MTGSAPKQNEAVLTSAGREALERMRRVSPDADPLSRLPDVPPERIPRHIAVIMDGNGRWAKERGMPRAEGHRRGALSVRATLNEAGALGIELLTLYSFSIENWKRPTDEVGALMQLCIEYCKGEKQELKDSNIRVQVIGRREGMPAEVLAALDDLVGTTASCTGPTLCLAINYGGRQEIADAAKALARKAQSGEIDPGSIDEAVFENALTTSGSPDPELIIRTAGEVRVSNFLLWQASYAELCVLDECWPDFDAASLHRAIRWYATRRRRFGGLDEL